MSLLKSHRNLLIVDLALGELTAGQLADKYSCEVTDLRAFVNRNREELEKVRKEVDANGLWVTSKLARLRRYQYVLDILLPMASFTDPMVIREIRSYLNDIADELGQLLNRGAGENVAGTRVDYTVNGVNPEDLM